MVGLALVALVGFLSIANAQQKELRNFEDVQGFSSDEADLPPLEVRVLDLEGSPRVLTPESDEWSDLQEGTTLPRESRIVTLKGDSVQMEIPGVSLITIDTGTEVVLSDLIRTVETKIDRSGLMIDVRKEVTNEVDIEAITGTINNSLRDHEDMKNDYKITMPQAVAGVRGTSFSCHTTPEETECSVLEGEIEFSLKDRSVSELLGAGLSARYQTGRVKPDTVAGLSETRREDLRRNRRQARSKLLFEPALSDFRVNENSFDSPGKNTWRQTLDYYRPRKLTITGEARAREEGTELDRVGATVDGESVPVKGLREWSLTTRPDTVPPGQQRTVRTTLTAVDDTGTRSYPETLLLELNHPDPEDVLPQAYDEGPVDVSLERTGNRSLDRMDYPYHLYRDDRRARDAGTLTFEGTASADSPIEGVAYSTNDGISWHRADGQSEWSFDVPVRTSGTRRVNPWVIAWSENQKIGSIMRTGTLVYHNQSLEKHVLDRFRALWRYTSTQKSEELATLLSESFEYTPENGSPGGKGDFLSFLKTLFESTRELEIYHRLRDVEVDRETAEIVFDLEVQGRYRPADSRFKLIGTSVTMSMDRTDSGKFHLSGLNGLRHRLYLFNASSLRLSSGEGVHFNDFQVRARQETVDVRLRKATVFGESRWVLKTDRNYQVGGIFRLNTDDLGEVFPIPERSSSLYQEAVRLKPNHLYAVNLEHSNGRETIGLLRVNSVQGDTVTVDLMTSLPFPIADS